jgi:hypothetical protein
LPIASTQSGGKIIIRIIWEWSHIPLLPLNYGYNKKREKEINFEVEEKNGPNCLVCTNIWE